MTPEAATLLDWLRSPISDADLRAEWDACRRANPAAFRFGLAETLAELTRAGKIERAADGSRWKWTMTTELAPRGPVAHARTLF